MGTELRRRSRLPSVCVALGFILLAFVGTLFVGSAGGPVHAQESDAPQSITGRVQNRSEQDGKRVVEPVPDVRVVAEDESGSVVGESVTDADGVYLIPIEQPGTYVVRIDTETLPEGLTVEEGKEQQTAVVGGNQNVTRAFFLGEDTRDVQSKLSLLPQTLANGLKLAMIIASPRSDCH